MSNHSNLSEIMVQNAELRAECERLKAELDQERVQHAGCLTAAEGCSKDPAVKGQYGWSLAYQKTLELRLKYEALQAENARLAAAVETEPELPGSIPETIAQFYELNPEECLRAVVRSTKHSIKARSSSGEALRDLLAPTIELLPQLQKLLEEYVEKDSCCCTEPGELCLYCEASNHLGPLTEELARLRVLTQTKPCTQAKCQVNTP